MSFDFLLEVFINFKREHDRYIGSIEEPLDVWPRPELNNEFISPVKLEVEEKEDES